MWRIWSVVFTLFLITRPLFPLVEYATNYNYISKVLCENKAKPELQCNGKCHLMKELAKASESDKSPSEPVKKTTNFTELFCDTSAAHVHNPNFRFYLPQHQFFYSDSYRFALTDATFHPPAV